MSWVKNLFSKVIPKRHKTNSNFGKSFNEKYQDLGAFLYDEESFTITYEDFTKRINWADITQLNVFKTDLWTIDRIDMEIVYGDKCYRISEDLPGWHQFVLKTKEIFPTIPKDWNSTITHPPFATNYKTIYDKGNLP